MDFGALSSVRIWIDVNCTYTYLNIFLLHIHPRVPLSDNLNMVQAVYRTTKIFRPIESLIRCLDRIKISFNIIENKLRNIDIFLIVDKNWILHLLLSVTETNVTVLGIRRSPCYIQENKGLKSVSHYARDAGSIRAIRLRGYFLDIRSVNPWRGELAGRSEGRLLIGRDARLLSDFIPESSSGP